VWPLLLENNQVNPESEDAVDALYWNGGAPYEFDLLWKQPVKTLVEKTMMYRTGIRWKAMGGFVIHYQKRRNAMSRNVSLAWLLDYLHQKDWYGPSTI
jgi:hypothetical protein